jgi:hypothetical protein
VHLLLLLDWNDFLQRLLEVDQMSIHGFLVIDELLDVSLKYFDVSVLVVLCDWESGSISAQDLLSLWLVEL